jgi:hypothetical protein
MYSGGIIPEMDYFKFMKHNTFPYFTHIAAKSSVDRMW